MENKSFEREYQYNNEIKVIKKYEICKGIPGFLRNKKIIRVIVELGKGRVVRIYKV